jgi:hypothetical protein
MFSTEDIEDAISQTNFSKSIQSDLFDGRLLSTNEEFSFTFQY